MTPFLKTKPSTIGVIEVESEPISIINAVDLPAANADKTLSFAI